MSAFSSALAVSTLSAVTTSAALGTDRPCHLAEADAAAQRQTPMPVVETMPPVVARRGVA
jgi:hypothetical protein